MKKRIAALILCIVLLLSFSVCCYAESATNEARKGVIRIVEAIYSDGALEGYAMGTGFFVGKEGEPVRYLVTNYHVVAKYIENGKGNTFEYKDKYGTKHIGQVMLEVFFDSKDSLEAYVVDYDDIQDIAVLKLEKATDKRISLPLLIPTDSIVGDEMYIVGYPGNADEYITSTSTWDVEDSLISKGTIGRLVTESGAGTKWIQSTDVPAANGNSGGPLLTVDGSVIGVTCKIATGSTDQYMNMGINIEPVVEMLRKNDVEYELANEKAAAPVEDPAEEPAEDPAEEPAPAPVEEPAEEKSILVPVIIAAAAVAVAAIAAAVILSRRKKSKKNSTTQIQEDIGKTVPARQVQDAKVPSPVIRSLAAQHGGKKVQIKNDPVVIGRNKDCTIVFRDDTPGVSSKHCAISYDKAAGAFIVKDMGSTYGTFLDSGMKLDPNRTYRLKAGDTVYLGDKANLLKVELE